MYVELLTNEQIKEFSTIIKEEAQKVTDSEWEMIISRPFNERIIIAIYCENPAWDINMNIYDFHVEVAKSVLLEHSLIKEKYAQFMHKIFGEEYKEKYVAEREERFEKY